MTPGAGRLRPRRKGPERAVSREVALTGFGYAGPWGLREVAPEDLHPANVAPRRPRPADAGAESFAVYPAAPPLLEATPRGLTPRQQRYLGRAARLAIAVANESLQRAHYPIEPASREPLACVVATSRGDTDPATTAAMTAAARADAGPQGRPLARSALATYMERRPLVQYLRSMETAVVGHVTAALGARGPAHAVTTPGLAGGLQAFLRCVRIVSRGDAPAALAVGVLTGEDEPGIGELFSMLGPTRPRRLIEGAGAVLVEEAEAVARSGRAAWCVLGSVAETYEPGPAPWPDSVGWLDESRDPRPFAGAPLALWWLGNRSADPLPGVVRYRGFLGHTYRLELLPAEGVAA